MIRVATCVAAALLIGFVLPLAAQRTETFTARLTWVPISGAERNDVAGQGSATATLSGSTLSFAGSFEGLPARATAARLHQGVAKGARGPVLTELTVTGAESGTISGTVELNAGQAQALREGRLYIQVHAEKGVAPDNSVLRGWLLQ